MPTSTLKHTFLFLLFCSFSTHSFSQAFGEKKNVLSVGYGVGTVAGTALTYFLPSYTSYLGIHKTMRGPFYLKYERAVSRHIGFGLNVAYLDLDLNFRNQVNNRTLYDVHLDYSTLSVLARMNIHIGHFEKVDPFIGFGLGYRSGGWRASYQFVSGDPNDPPRAVEIRTLVPIGFELTAGTRYWFTEYIGAYAEIGLAKSLLQFGITGRF